MRYLLSLSFIFLLPLALLAQDKYQLFYAPNAYSLTAKQQADLTKILRARPLSVLKIQPFTDDLGSDIDNEVLAENRAKTIIQFVQELGFKQLQFEQLPYERQPLNGQLPIAEARQQLRRIDLYFYNTEEFEEVKNNDVWASFYAGQRKKAQQFFSFSAQKGKFIQGKEGIQIDIPANSFLLANGKTYQGQVSLVLQEALSMKDMILQNLTTTSNGELIETGGMIYLAAKGENGEELRLAEGKKITLGFPGTAAALPGMQIFQGPHTANPHSDINWQATGSQQIWAREREGQRGLAFLDSSYFARQEELIYLTKEPILSLRNKRALNSFKLRLPRLKVERTFVDFDAYLAKKYPKKKGETEEVYQQRIGKEQQQARKSYNNKKRQWRKKYKTYQKDSTAYAKQRNQYAAEQKAYNDFLNEEHQEAKELLAYLQAFSHERLGQLLSEQTEYLLQCYNLDEYGRHKSTLGGHQELLPLYQNQKKGDFTAEIAAVEGLRPEFDADAYQKPMENYIGFLKKYYEKEKQNWTEEIEEEEKGRKKESELVWKKDMELEALKIKLAYLLKEELRGFSPEGQKKYLALKKQLNKKNIEKTNRNWRTEAYSNCLHLSLQAETAQQKAAKLCQRTDSLDAEILAKKDRYGILKEEEANKKVLSQMEISGLGWINCDRFLNDDVDKMNLTLANASTNTQYFLIFKNINSIMRANSQAAFSNVPKAYQAKLIGIKYLGDQLEFMKMEAKISDLQNMEGEFKPINDKELAAELEAL
ncbi:cell envelope biogenesis protein OmpA [Saprospira sp. CCB-QB6]|uniref:cell envelope biogenesis protein OmpA n=1 Tax=Saprospira sp. CCB-QB6 TaxID=3023936 RepID=UPI00234B4462|nr:cell envelope biogenesis protein OmpA [Saprospira sp. CCB-QB6]WCL80920.1 cell envelope biogenesis protein OmpA [Saprospira sp. CCB-QB6]